MTSDTPTIAPRNPILEDAWDRYSRYDFNASKAQKRFIQQRKLILILGVAATTLAIIYTVLETRSEGGIPWLSDGVSRFLQDQFLPALHVLVVLVPILSTALIAYSLRFNMGANWIALRSSAEALKKEIYLYRMQVGEYRLAVLGSESRDVHLARKAKIINKRLMETQVNQTGLEAYKGKLPPKYSTADGDDGFSDMTAEQYLLWRIEDQFSYYQRKSVKFTTELQRFQLGIILLGGLGTALAAFNLEIWVAVSGALATAFATFLEFKGVETTIIACNTAAADLYDVRTWWRALSDDAKASPANIETLVHSAEAIVQSENAGWVQEMRDALAEIYSGDKEEVSKKETFAVALGDKFLPPVADETTQSNDSQYVEPAVYGAVMTGYSTVPSTGEVASDAPIEEISPETTSPQELQSSSSSDITSDITSEGTEGINNTDPIPPEIVPEEPFVEQPIPEESRNDLAITSLDHTDPFSEPPAEPVVHDNFSVDMPAEGSSPELISLDLESVPIDIAADPSINTPIDTSIDAPVEILDETPIDLSSDLPADSSDDSLWDVLVDIPADAPMDAPVIDEALIPDPSETLVADQSSPAAASSETSEASTSEDPQQDEPSMTTMI